jgi:hypothetical protein
LGYLESLLKNDSEGTFELVICDRKIEVANDQGIAESRNDGIASDTVSDAVFLETFG